MSNISRISVSVVVLTYKQPESLGLIIQSINRQTYVGEIEVIVSDDGSPQSIAAMNEKIVRSSVWPTKYVWQPDRGYRAAAARNNGVRSAQNTLLIFLDGDIVPHPQLIERHVAQHTVPNRLVAGNRTWVGEVSGIKDIEELAKVTPQPEAVIRGRRENHFRHELLRSAHPWRACFSANLSVERAPFTYFDERFVGWGPEDAEFCHRMCVMHGLSPIYDESIGSYHLESPEAVGNIFRKGGHEAIVNYLRNIFFFHSTCPELRIEDVFYGLRRLRLDESTDHWRVIPRTESEGVDLITAVEKARHWLNSYSP